MESRPDDGCASHPLPRIGRGGWTLEPDMANNGLRQSGTVERMFKGHDEAVLCCCLSPDGTRVLSYPGGRKWSHIPSREFL